jgi:hypothetical protein
LLVLPLFGLFGRGVPVKDDSIVNVSVPVDLCTTVSRSKAKAKKQKQKKKDGGKSFALLDMEKSTRSSADIGFCLYSSQTYDMSLLYRTFYFILFYYGTIELYIVGRRLYRSK